MCAAVYAAIVTPHAPRALGATMTALAAAALVGCAASDPPAYPLVTRAELTDVTPREARLELRLLNPDPGPIYIESMTYALTAADAPAARGETVGPWPIDAGEDIALRVRAVLDTLGNPLTTRPLRLRGTLRFAPSGLLRERAILEAPFDLPVDSGDDRGA